MTAPAILLCPPEIKKVKLIGTHNGEFHCDESLACALLLRTAEFSNADILRTRNLEHLKCCDIVVDVGAEYDPNKLRFDHHQLSFTGTMATTEAEYKTRLSSAGLIYKHYGREIIKDLFEGNVTEDEINLIYDRVYRNFIEHVDANDNGVEQYSLSKKDTDVTLVNNYKITTSLPARVRNLGTKWNECSSAEKDAENFRRAMKLTESEFVDCVMSLIKVWLPARSIVSKSFEDRFSVHESGRIIRLDTPCPWQEHLYDIESRAGVEGYVYYILYNDQTGNWRVQCVGIKGSAYTNRKPLSWKGLRDEELSHASGIPDCIFVHANGFIGGNKTFQGAFDMAIKSLERED